MGSKRSAQRILNRRKAKAKGYGEVAFRVARGEYKPTPKKLEFI